MKYITDELIEKINISPLKAVSWVKESFCLKQASILPVKTSLHFGDCNYFNTMPAIVPKLNIMGCKIIDRYIERNPKVDGQIFIYDYNNGNLKYMLDAFWITTARTGAVGALAVMYLAPADFSVIGIMGLGNTARATMSCLLEQYKNKKLKVKLLRYKNHCEEFIKAYSKYENVTFTICDSIKELVIDSDVIISCITNTNEIIAQPEWFKKGCLIVPIHNKGFQSCDTVFDKIIGDDYGHISGFKYFNKFKQFIEFTDVITGKSVGRENDAERIISYNLGLIIHDLVFASHIINLIDTNNLTEIKLYNDAKSFQF